MTSDELKMVVRASNSWLAAMTEKHGHGQHLKLSERGPAIVRLLLQALVERELQTPTGLKQASSREVKERAATDRMALPKPRAPEGIIQPVPQPPPVPRRTQPRRPTQMHKLPQRANTVFSPEERAIADEIAVNVMRLVDVRSQLPNIGDDDIESVVFEQPVDKR